MESEHEPSRSALARLQTPKAELLAAILAGALLLVGALLALFEPTIAMGRLGTALIWASLAIGMIYGGRAAFESLAAREFDIDVLMVIGAALAAITGHPGEGALLLFLFVLAGALEDLAMARTTRAVEALHNLLPVSALRWDDARQEWLDVEPEALAVNDRVKILPGESVPTDATVELGTTSVDQSTLTGESIPRIINVGDELYAGAINVGNPIEAVVTRPASESSLQRILNLVIEAQQQREPVQRLIDRVSQPYAISVMVLSIAVFLIWWGLLGFSASASLSTAITLLIVASPCAVIISTPTATLATITRAARSGVLLKGGQAIERLSRMKAIAFDKTGTLTIGRPRVQRVHPIGWSDAQEMLAIAAGLEQDSTHPIAGAIRDAADERDVTPLHAERSQFEPGSGVSGSHDGIEARLGTFAHVEPLVPECLKARVQEVLARARGTGQIAVVVAWNEQAGVIILSDDLRPGAADLVDRLSSLAVAPVCMLTGDGRATAEYIAGLLGIQRWQAEMHPEDKVSAVQALKQEVAGPVAVIGDGVNDAPALSAADVSVAIGSIGSDAALESSDIVLLSEDLSRVPWALTLARRARGTVRANLVFAIGAIALMVIATLVGSLMGTEFRLWMGVLGHEGGTLLVVGNSLLLLLFRDPAPSSPLPEVAPEIETADLLDARSA